MKLIKSIFLKDFTVNVIIFIFFSIIITYLSNKVSEKIYCYKNWLYRERDWEKGGQFYEEKLSVKKWKKKIPELGDFIKSVFPKKYISNYSKEYLLMYVTESCKAELTHWAIIGSTFLFLFWNEPSTFFIIFLSSFILNIPFVIIQRYNRPRIMRIMRQRGIEY